MNPIAYERNAATGLQESGVLRGLRLAARAAFGAGGGAPQLILVIMPVSLLADEPCDVSTDMP